MRQLLQTCILIVLVAAAVLSGAQPATAQVPAGVGYYPQPYYPTVYYANPYWGYAPAPPFIYSYGYQYRWNYVYQPWGGYYTVPRYYTPPAYWGYSVRWTRGGYWRAW